MTILLTIHIISFGLSLIIMPALLLSVLAKVRLPSVVQHGSLAATIIGVTSGAALLVASPSGKYCAALTVYVLAFTALYLKARVANKTTAPATI
jgi:hypothetical protein